ncbi:MAG: hypothetical protein HQM14_19670 [SAR324 cluster bacterium]|nr:hypothetical protein [SAR324 cluster bacterium]
MLTERIKVSKLKRKAVHLEKKGFRVTDIEQFGDECIICYSRDRNGSQLATRRIQSSDIMTALEQLASQEDVINVIGGVWISDKRGFRSYIVYFRQKPIEKAHPPYELEVAPSGELEIHIPVTVNNIGLVNQ